MIHLKLILFFFILFFACSDIQTNSDSGTGGVIDLSDGWKFQIGDQAEWNDPNFDDSGWVSIQPHRLWEYQGFPDYDGYAWYRIKIVIPSHLKEHAYFKDSLQIVLGKIDDTEQTFLNGKQIGQNGRFIPADAVYSNQFTGDREAYAIFRQYVLAVDDPRILWDQENVIAIRVHDHGGGGGLYSSGQSISMVDLKDYLKIRTDLDVFKTVESDQFGKTITLQNLHPAHRFNGWLKIWVINQTTDQKIFETTETIAIDNGQSQAISYAFSYSRTEPHTAEYRFIEAETRVTVSASEEVPYILTPRAKDEPRITGPKRYGARPGVPFLFTIPATGLRPMTFTVKNLPQGLIVDGNTGTITGTIQEPGEYIMTLVVKNEKGEDSREFKIVIGDQIALTPPMGWNSWNCWGLSVDDARVRAAADFMISSGLINHGWTYINIDDGWEAPERRPNGEIAPNEKFPDMKALADYVHHKGLKLGIYSSPGPFTCGGYLGTYQHELQDARTYAQWGIDYLKYDWCSYGNIARDNSLPELQKPYVLMREMLNQVKRDIVYSLCQYGMGEVWKWGARVGGNLWRTTGDIVDSWESMSGIGFNQDVMAEYAGPGNWNDPDMLVVGKLGWGPNLHPTRLTASEQYTHISLWCLLSAPLLLGCDLSQLDEFTLNLLTNDEVLAIDQDPLGRQARPIYRSGSIQIWAKDLEDSSKVVGLFNLDPKPQVATLNWSDLQINGNHLIRDLWRQKDLGVFNRKFETRIPIHGVVLIKIRPMAK